MQQWVCNGGILILQVISKSSPDEKVVRVQYDDARQFKTYAKQLGLMDDLKVILYKSEHMIKMILLYLT